MIELIRKRGYELIEREMSRYDLYTADELFLTGTAAEVVPVSQYDERVIGDGTPGPITREMMTAFHELAGSTGTPIYEEVPVA